GFKLLHKLNARWALVKITNTRIFGKGKAHDNISQDALSRTLTLYQKILIRKQVGAVILH
ncbi:hypothetical protein, partial [Dysgonomonas sp. ZJ709]|uniref:hypothetical protein n=1 Tax=Dysgonomonas sp. ZJ709 TaxID=2709797 RepID=UPI001C8697C4